MAQVAIVRCDEYQQELVDTAVRCALDNIGGLYRFVKPGQRVLLKVNALTMKPPEAAVTTHPAFIKAVVREVQQAGGIALVGDSSGGMAAGQAPTRQTFQVAGIARAAEEAGAELINFDISGVCTVKAGGPVQTLHIAKPVLEADVVISLPKLKTHSAAVYTGAVKNMYGSIPGHRKSDYHRMAPKLKDFAEVLVDILAAAKPALAIMDAIVGMEGNGPSAGNPRKIGLVLASSDCVALDAAASKIIGLEPLQIHTTSIAYQRGLGVGDLAKIEVLGEKLEDVLIPDFALPSNALLETMPGFLVQGMLGMLKARPEINTKTCAGCRFCVESCPVEAMNMTAQFPEIDYQKCISCLCCQELCPQKAVEMKQTNPIGRIVAGIISRSKEKKRAKYDSE
jgi:uncharacterized protein (DUF362 family)/Pyruvate/2-oxoacid:ferredoxin oxidoreductase delta subunit